MWHHFLFSKDFFIQHPLCLLPCLLRFKENYVSSDDVVPFPAANDDTSWQLSHGGYQSLVQVAGRKNGKTQKNHLFT